MSIEPRCIHALVSGRVQSVGYRAFVQIHARQAGIIGWIRNLPDGRVELVAQGSTETLQNFQEDLWAGPPLARVEDVRLEAAPVGKFSDFSVRR